jgi:O-antigen ligase
MLDKLTTYRFPAFVFIIISAVGFSSLWYSPAILSVSSFLLIVIAILSYKASFSKKLNGIAFSLIFIFLLYILDVFRSADASVSLNKILLLLVFVGLQLACFAAFGKLKAHLILLFLILSSMILVVDIVAVTNYLMHKEYYNALLLQSKHIPIPNMHHIHFGILNAWVILGLAGLLYFKKLHGNKHYVGVGMLVVIAICCHILSSRTGLMALYSGFIVSLLVLVYQQKSVKPLFLGILSIVIFMSVAYVSSTSFRSKTANSLEGYKTSIFMLRNNPLGVGAEAQEAKMQEAYTLRNSVLFKVNRVGSHNQFLEYGVKFGWVGILSLLFYFSALFKILPSTTFPFWGIMTIFFVSLQFESLLERQASLFFISLLLPLSYYLFIKEEINGTKVT